MRVPQIVDELLYFPHLDVSGNLSGVYALAWRMTDDQNDEWTARLMRFKYAKPEAIKGACRVLPAVLGGMRDRLPEPVILVSAIPHDQTSLPANHPLRSLAKAVASKTGWQWMPGALSKKKHRRLVELGQGEDRDDEVNDKYAAASVTDAKSCVILDDLVTRGATLNDAARAIRESSPSIKHVYGLALGKNERRGWAKQCGYDLNNDHLPRELLEMWDAA